MSDDDPAALAGAVDTALERFEYGRGTVETGFDQIDSEDVTQLRKACRLLAAARTLRDADGFHTAVVELSFGAIERSFEFYAMAVSTDTAREFHDHDRAYDRAAELGVISVDLRDEYKALYGRYRTESYYGNRAASDVESEAMFELAAETHEFLRDHPPEHYDCLCEQ
jgi:hypothetical protein